ncbi:MAG: class II glutamine amidotransferase [Rhodobacteraceae bacterium]|nr:class II glutamine amidotransferase [Paracoccaceae bacterium]
MCELFAMSASRPTVVQYTLDRFAREGGERHRNRDGWGIVFAEDRDAHVYREAAPAADSALARMVVARETPCRHLIAHVRRASKGAAHLANTHPFTRVQGGRMQHFAHNGTLHGIDDLAPGLRDECVGDTDSELAFLMLLRILRDLPHGPGATADRFARFRDFAARMAELGDANIVFFDGETLFAHAHLRMFETETGLSAPLPPGLCLCDLRQGGAWQGAGAHIPDLPDRTLLLASVPLSHEGWHPLPPGRVLAVRDGQILHQAG